MRIQLSTRDAWEGCLSAEQHPPSLRPPHTNTDKMFSVLLKRIKVWKVSLRTKLILVTLVHRKQDKMSCAFMRCEASSDGKALDRWTRGKEHPTSWPPPKEASTQRKKCCLHRGQRESEAEVAAATSLSPAVSAPLAPGTVSSFTLLFFHFFPSSLSLCTTFLSLPAVSALFLLLCAIHFTQQNTFPTCPSFPTITFS